MVEEDEDNEGRARKASRTDEHFLCGGELAREITARTKSILSLFIMYFFARCLSVPASDLNADRGKA